uniref:exodeoxyribonuclease III n=1 Tax=Astyanax mexicanus TaxID=7994 RepID=A0A3B1JVZ9_ASTMX
MANCNIRGIQSANNRNTKLNILKTVNLDILCLQETRLTSYKNICDAQTVWGEHLSFFSIGEDKAGGVAILFYTKNVSVLKIREIIPGRLMYVDIYLMGKKIRIINVYAFPNYNKRVSLLNKLKTILYVGFPKIICGDFNTITDLKDSNSDKLSKIGYDGCLLKQIMCENELNDIFRVLFPDKKRVFQI